MEFFMDCILQFVKFQHTVHLFVLLSKLHGITWRRRRRGKGGSARV